jgi:death-on-curing protein
VNFEPEWVSLEGILVIHDVQISRFGGCAGLRDRGLLESALARPQQIYCYSEDVRLTELAAAYAFGIIKNHAFIDGNKRTGFLAAYTFLGLNGWTIKAEQADVIAWGLGVASGGKTEREFAAWLDGVVTEA